MMAPLDGWGGGGSPGLGISLTGKGLLGGKLPFLGSAGWM